MNAAPTHLDGARIAANLVAIPLGIAASYVVPEVVGRSVGEVSRASEPMLAAAGWTFAIWGVIFLGQMVYAVHQALPANWAVPALRRIGWLTALASLASGAWVFFFVQRRFVEAYALLLVTLSSLVAVEVLRRDYARGGPALLTVRVPYSLNLGWVLVASVLGTAQVLHVAGHWDGGLLGAERFSVLLVFVATLLGAFLVVGRANLGAGLAIAWGLGGVFDFERAQSQAIAGVAAFGMISIVALLVVEIGRLAKHGWRGHRLAPPPRAATDTAG